MRRYLIMSAAMLSLLAPAERGVAQQQPVPPPSSAPPSSAPDIVVEGIIVPGDEVPRTPGANLGGSDPRQTVIANRIRLEFATRFAECAGRGNLSSMALLRSAVDGMPYDANQRFAQGRLLQANVTCARDTGVVSALPTDLGMSLYDRGALMIEVLRRYAPDLKISRAQTRDAAVQMRYDQREIPRNRHRLQLDYDYFQLATCVVRMQPTLSVRLALDERSPQSTLRLENAMVAGARPCVGGAHKVLFDPTQFRLYIADAVYRWAVAARGVDSLIPAPEPALAGR